MEPYLLLRRQHCSNGVCMCTFAGLVGAGTNNARLAGLLRGLSSYYYKEPTALFLVRVAQGLVHMGKGLLTMAPQHSDGQLISGRVWPQRTALQTSETKPKPNTGIKDLCFLAVGLANKSLRYTVMITAL